MDWVTTIIIVSAAAGAPVRGDDAPLRGVVLDPLGSPAAGARVRYQASDVFALSGVDGAFELGPPPGPIKLVAGLEGYRNGYTIVSGVPGGAPSVEVRLKALPAEDNPAYVWEPPTSCAQCHATLHREWAASPHASAAIDPVVLALYRGTNYDGSPSTGFGFRKAHPETYGDCAFCHAPSFAARSADPTAELDPFHDLDRAVREGTPAERSGVHCDFCHKVRSVVVDDHPPRLGQNLQLLRPPQFDPLMFGPFDDVTFVGMGASYSPLHGEKADLCSLCHWDTNRHGVTAGGTYKEWLDGPYPSWGKRCHDCHMTPTLESDIFCLWEPVSRNPHRIHSHSFRGTDAAHLTRALSLDLSATRLEGPAGPQVEVEVLLTNSGAGHAVPTGVTLRQVLLVVEARRGSGAPLELAEGPRLPAWAGEGGPPSEGYLAGLPGRGYAKIVTDGAAERVFDSEATAIVSDNRILPQATDRSTYRFATGGYRGDIAVRARVIHRKYWKDLEDERGFPDGDSPMTEQALTLPGDAPEFLRGDTDGTGALDITDAVAALGHLFIGEPASLLCPDAADADDSGLLDITDAISILGHLFLGAPPPPEPYPDPGADPTPDALDC